MMQIMTKKVMMQIMTKKVIVLGWSEGWGHLSSTLSSTAPRDGIGVQEKHHHAFKLP